MNYEERYYELREAVDRAWDAYTVRILVILTK